MYKIDPSIIVQSVKKVYSTKGHILSEVKNFTYVNNKKLYIYINGSISFLHLCVVCIVNKELMNTDNKLQQTIKTV